MGKALITRMGRSGFAEAVSDTCSISGTGSRFTIHLNRGVPITRICDEGKNFAVMGEVDGGFGFFITELDKEVVVFEKADGFKLIAWCSLYEGIAQFSFGVHLLFRISGTTTDAVTYTVKYAKIYGF